MCKDTCIDSPACEYTLPIIFFPCTKEFSRQRLSCRSILYFFFSPSEVPSRLRGFCYILAGLRSLRFSFSRVISPLVFVLLASKCCDLLLHASARLRISLCSCSSSMHEKAHREEDHRKKTPGRSRGQNKETETTGKRSR